MTQTTDNVTSVRLAFFGTPEIAAVHLRALLAASWRPVVVVTQPDRRAGRGNRLKAPVVKQVAEEAGLTVWQPERIRKRATIDTFAAWNIDVAVVVAYGQILAARMLQAPRLGTYNVHASLLPRWRGPAPIEWALLAGDETTGVTLQRMVRRLDEGPILGARSLAIDAADDRESLHDKLAPLGAELLVETLPRILEGRAEETPQAEEGVTYAPIPTRAEAWLEPRSMSAVEVHRRVRALGANPGTWVEAVLAEGEARGLKLLRVEPVSEREVTQWSLAGRHAAPGERVHDTASAHDFVVACAQQTYLRIRRCQPASKPPMDAKAYLAGHKVVALRAPDE